MITINFFTKKWIFVQLFVLLTAIAGLSASNLPLQYEQEALRRYLHELRTQSNLQIDPCSDYRQYACSNLNKQPNLGLPGPIDDQNYDLVIRKLLIDSMFKSESERKVSDLFLSCRKERDPKQIFKQIESLRFIDSWPVVRKPLAKNIGFILGEMSSIATSQYGIFNLKVNESGRRLEFRPIAAAPILNFDDVLGKMQQMSVNSLNFTYETDRIVEFAKKLNQLERLKVDSSIDKTVENYLQLNDLLPHFDWAEYFKGVFNLTEMKPESFYEIPIRLNNFETLSRMLDLLAVTDTKVIVNYLVYNYIEYLTDFKCEKFIPFFRPTILKKIWERNLNEANQEKQLKNLNRFENNLKMVESEMKQMNFASIKQLIETKRYVIENQSSILNDEVYDQFYSSFNIDAEKYYLNVMRYTSSMLKYWLPHLKNIFLQKPEDEGFFRAIVGQLDNAIDPLFSAKPFLYYFISENLYMWQQLFESNSNYDWRNHTTATNCLDQQNEIHIIEENYEYLNAYSANRVAYLDYMQYLYKSGLRMVIDAEINAIGLGDSERVYFLALMQNVCHRNKPQLVDRLLRVLRHSEQFVEAYQCPPTSEMNRLQNKSCKMKRCSQIQPDPFKLQPFKLVC